MRGDLSIIPLVFVVALLCGVLIAEPSFAAKGSATGHVLCTVAGWFTGNVGKGLAMVAVFSLGVAALLGKITWGAATVVGAGIAVVFGGDAILLQAGLINCKAIFN